ncbi:vitamin K epoxide reductase family protein [Micromonospora sp. NBC_01405]
MMGWILTIGGLVGALAAFVLTVEKIALLKNPAYVPSCSINPILSCGSIMTTGQAEVFGFPNPLIGLAAFPVVAATGIAVLARLQLPRWWWLGMQAGTLFGVAFVHWLFFQSLYRIGALCPYCMIVWVVMIVLFSYTTLYNLQDGRLPAPRRITAAALRVHSAIPTLWLLAFTVLIGVRFWTYWRTLI